MYALCWVQLKNIFHWGKSDLDHILVEGDSLYKSLGTLDMVSAEQLPEFVKMFSHNIPIQYGRLETQLATLKNRNSFLRDVLTETTGTALCFLFMESFTTTIILSGNCFYLFESHSRNERGLSIADGTSALVKFNDLFKTEKYIQVAYLE